jgi:RNA-directed DNA polymerase
MINGRGKSDPGIGAVKPANKAAPSAAELVEQRTGAKGNARQQSMCRAQDRESVSQALERIRRRKDSPSPNTSARTCCGRRSSS